MIARDARVAGLLYLLLVVIAPLRLIYIPGTLFVNGDAAATVSNIVAHESLFRLGIVSDLFCGTLEIFLVLALYRLFRQVDRTHAVLMLVLGLMPVPIYFLNTLNDIAALVLSTGPDFLSAFDKPQRDALAMLFLRLHDAQINALQIFWGAWLFPLAVLVIRSRFLPRFLGVWLIINGFAYLALSLSGLLATEFQGTLSKIALPAQLGEVAFTLWLLIMGARMPSPSVPVESEPRVHSPA